MISISLLIKAYSEFIKYLYLDENLKYKKIQDYYLFNSVETGELKYKLILTKHDKEIFEGILEDRDLSVYFGQTDQTNHTKLTNQLGPN